MPSSNGIASFLRRRETRQKSTDNMQALLYTHMKSVGTVEHTLGEDDVGAVSDFDFTQDG